LHDNSKLLQDAADCWYTGAEASMKTWLLVAVTAAACAAQPLRVLPANPRWFADGSGKAVLLVGSHTWASLQDNGLLMRGAVSNPPAVFDYDGYLSWLAQNNHNFFRLWRWETTK
jgi:hypothetical protein